MVYVSAPGSDEPSVPPAQLMVKQFDTNGDGLVQRDEVKSDAFLTEHFGYIDASGDGAVDLQEYNYVRNAGASGYGLTAIRIGGAGDRTATNVAYMVKTGGIVTVLDPVTGEILKTGRIEKAIEEYFSSPVAAGGKLFFVSESGKVGVV